MTDKVGKKKSRHSSNYQITIIFNHLGAIHDKLNLLVSTKMQAFCFPGLLIFMRAIKEVDFS